MTEDEMVEWPHDSMDMSLSKLQLILVHKFLMAVASLVEHKV